MIIIKIIILVVFITAFIYRADVVLEARVSWNYYIYRYKNHCRIHYSQEEKSEALINENIVTLAEALLVVIMFWKINPDYFFDSKPDWVDIHEMYLQK